MGYHRPAQRQFGQCAIGSGQHRRGIFRDAVIGYQATEEFDAMIGGGIAMLRPLSSQVRDGAMIQAEVRVKTA